MHAGVQTGSVQRAIRSAARTIAGAGADPEREGRPMIEIRFHAWPSPPSPHGDEPPPWRTAALFAALLATTVTLGSTLAPLTATLPPSAL